MTDPVDDPVGALVIRRATPGDAPALASICRASFPTTARWQASRRAAERWWRGAIASAAAEVWAVRRASECVALLLVILDESVWKRERRRFGRPSWRDPVVLALRPIALWRILRHRFTARAAPAPSPIGAVSPARAERLWLELIAVAPRARGQGLGQRLVALCEHRAAIHDRSEVRLRVEAHNRGAIAMYQREGFSVTTATPRALVMSRAVDPAILPPREFGLLEKEPAHP
ncbi:MAG TPA: hypothetical protein DEB06_09260 [Phycisphaerales bacterium]|nr:hypothetical protein [Phycisphaerales bacterium]